MFFATGLAAFTQKSFLAHKVMKMSFNNKKQMILSVQFMFLPIQTCSIRDHCCMLHRRLQLVKNLSALLFNYFHFLPFLLSVNLDFIFLFLTTD